MSSNVKWGAVPASPWVPHIAFRKSWSICGPKAAISSKPLKLELPEYIAASHVDTVVCFETFAHTIHKWKITLAGSGWLTFRHADLHYVQFLEYIICGCCESAAKI
jgi:hypothetical protein